MLFRSIQIPESLLSDSQEFSMISAGSLEPLLSRNARDASKRKRLNRTAKLKQYKLDARREQWLSQGKNCSRSDLDLNCKDWKDNEHKEAEISSGVSEQDVPIKSEGSTMKSYKISSEEFTGSVTEGSDNESSVLNFYEDQFDSNVTDSHKDGHFIARKDGDHINEDESKSESRTGGFHHSLTASSPERDRNTILTRDGCSKQNAVNDCSGPKGKSKKAKEKRKISSIRNMMKSNGITDDTFSQIKQKQEQLKDWLSGDISPCLSTDSSTNHSVISISSKGTEGSHDEEDWEAAADALYAQTLLDRKQTSALESVLHKVQQSAPLEREQESKGARNVDIRTSVLKPDYMTKFNPFFSRSRSTGCRAWKPDDISRPPTLPSLRKQRSTSRDSSSPSWSSVFSKSVRAAPATPAGECPICTEELDSTDASFLPCACGFLLCLFCVHRIASEDGRCPGCRRGYNFDVSLNIISLKQRAA
ncbi:hypothetical protein O6H91_Y330100 [Diphasiastrum complanatum]|nr:hypothetical protein O6H91_Y330100 [Diphasiastrum complanatum]